MDIDITTIDTDKECKLSFFANSIQAGFPSPAQNYYSDTIDLNRELITNPSATFCAHAIGDSMIDAGINSGDLLIIDKSLDPEDGNIAICFIDGEFTVKRISITTNGIFLVPGNSNYPSIQITQHNNFQIWGIVTHIIKKVHK